MYACVSNNGCSNELLSCQGLRKYPINQINQSLAAAIATLTGMTNPYKRWLSQVSEEAVVQTGFHPHCV